MRGMKYIVFGIAFTWITVFLDTVICLSMQVIEDSYRPCYQEELPEEEITLSENSTRHRMIATAYCLKGQTASSEYVREGIVASKPEWIGRTVAIYYENKDGSLGDFIGYYEVKDTGGENIQAGRVIDIWMPTYEQCKQFGSRRVTVFLFDKEVTHEKAKKTNLFTEKAIV